MKLFIWLEGLLRGPGKYPLEDLGVKELRKLEDWQAALADSETQPILVFKHSTTCPISAAAHHRFSDYLTAGDTPPAYLVKVIESRPVSNAIAADLDVTHQSPQAILVRGRRAVWNASHGQISSESIGKATQTAN